MKQTEIIDLDISEVEELNCYFVNYTNLLSAGRFDSNRRLTTSEAANVYLNGNKVVHMTVPKNKFGTVWHLFAYKNNEFYRVNIMGNILRDKNGFI